MWVLTLFGDTKDVTIVDESFVAKEDSVKIVCKNDFVLLGFPLDFLFSNKTVVFAHGMKRIIQTIQMVKTCQNRFKM